jgi:hypothetical protein
VIISERYEEHIEKYDSVWERVWMSVEVMMSPGTIQSRLGSAHLTLLPLLARDFPEEARPTFRKIMEDLEAHYNPGIMGDCYVELDDDDSLQLAKRIMSFYSSIDSIRIAVDPGMP